MPVRAILLVCIAGCLATAEGDSGAMSVALVDGRLAYAPDAAGNIVPDFSLAGYRHGGVALPTAPVVRTIGPVPGLPDDSPRIQTAVDAVAAMAERPQDGVRGAVLLRKGTWHCGTTLRIPPGVVLRGEGQGPDGTILIATMRQKDAEDRPVLIQLDGGGGVETAAQGHAILDDRVPLGARRLRVERAAALRPGSSVVLVFRPNQAWIRDLRMDRIEVGSGGSQWEAGDYVLRWSARIVSVDGDVVATDAPVVNALERRYGTAELLPVTGDRRGRAAAVEDLRLVSRFESGKEDSDENHAWNAIHIRSLVDGWVRNVTALHFAFGCVEIAQDAGRITVQDCAVLDPVSRISGGRRYSFLGRGQFCLFQRCYARNGRHDFVTGRKDMGPTVFLDCLAEQTHADIGPHHRWACGQLYDGIRGGVFRVQDRGGMGSGHGWAGNCQVFWNCAGDELVCQKPWIDGAQNWAIGWMGRKGTPHEADRPDGRWESAGAQVVPRSLYLAQLRERFERGGGSGAGAVQAVATSGQMRGTIWDELRRTFASDR